MGSKRACIGLAALLASVLFNSSAIAANVDFIDNNSFTTDKTSGLDWLDVTTTHNMSYNEVSSQFGSGGAYEGWRYATTNELVTLIYNWSGLTVSSAPNAQTFHTEGSDSIDGLVDLLGSTLDLQYLHYYGKTWADEKGYLNEEDGKSYTSGLLSDFTVAWLEDREEDQPFVDYSQPHRFQWAADSKNIGFGSFLVREGQLSTIPLPASVWMFGAAIVGIGIWGRRYRKTV